MGLGLDVRLELIKGKRRDSEQGRRGKSNNMKGLVEKMEVKEVQDY